MASVCDTKVFYDTEFEATIAAAHHASDMKPYQCGNHWHVTHADPRRSPPRCPKCKRIYPRKPKRHICPERKKKK